MKKEIALFLLALFLLFSAVEVISQTKSYISVRGNQLSRGVLAIDIVRAGKPYRLRCHRGAPGCRNLKNDKYVMVELPENFGMYDCKCVEVYPEDADDPKKDRDKRIGEYCLIEK